MNFKMISKRANRPSKFVAAILLLSINLIPTAPVFADFGTGAPTIPNAQPFGIDKQTAKVDSATGAFSQHVALDPDVLPLRSRAPGKRLVNCAKKYILRDIMDRKERSSASHFGINR